MPASPTELPIVRVLPDVIENLREHRRLCLVAPTGAGKTTQLPGALVDGGLGRVVVLEPRRLAARAAARRVAHERGVKLGAEVGYTVRFDDRTSRETAIRFVTQGIFLRQLQADPFLEGTGVVVLDEFHERSLDLDLSLSLVWRVMQEVRDDLRLVVTSATLDAERIAGYLDGAPIVRSEGRLFPITTGYEPARGHEKLEAHVARGVERALAATDGDVLVFLPGKGEIRRASEATAGLARSKGAVLLPLHGELDAKAQDAVLEPSEKRKLVLATNLAESSVTVPGVTAVVDTGLARILRQDPATGLDKLELSRISIASAEQRQGRAGRVREGHCIRLWSPAEERSFPAFEEPEVTRIDLSGALLELLAWGESDVASFPWFDAPSASSLSNALELLRLLGAIDARGGITALGRTLVRLPLQPRLGRLLVAGFERGVPEGAAAAAAILSERDPMRIEDRRVERFGSDSDVIDRVRALLDFERTRHSRELHRGGAFACLAVKSQLERLAQNMLGRASSEPEDATEALARALYDTFPDRLTRRRTDSPDRGVLVGGRGVSLAPECAVREGELFLSIDLDARGGEARVRKASWVEREWIEGGERTVTAHVFDTERKRVVGKKRVQLGELVLDEVETPVTDALEAAHVLERAASADLERALDLTDRDKEQFLARARCLAEWLPELELPSLDDTFLRGLLGELCQGARSFGDLQRAPLIAAIRGRWSHAQWTAFDKEAPERLPVPSGSNIRLAYEPKRPPILAARIQELFGLTETPRVARGRVPVLLHLLAPNGRPQQVTDDLASFWSTTYFQVRKDLRARYPKHDWPEDPTTAIARRRPRRPR